MGEDDTWQCGDDEMVCEQTVRCAMIDLGYVRASQRRQDGVGMRANVAGEIWDGKERWSGDEVVVDEGDI